jgi:hypothetical protein
LDYTLFDTARFKAALLAMDDAMVAANLRDFVFTGAFSSLERLKSAGWKLALLTLGEPSWQERKAVLCGLGERFDFTIFTAQPKETHVADFSSWPHPLVFVNDHGEELDRLKRALPDAKMLVIRSHKPPPVTPGIPTFQTLEEITEAIL